jgi:CO/xanthine dehydrogenase Mo-binding subunit
VADGDVDAALKEAAVVIDETVVCQSTSHQCMEPRTSMALAERQAVSARVGADHGTRQPLGRDAGPAQGRRKSCCLASTSAAASAARIPKRT